MTDKVETSASALDTVKLVAAVAILVGGIAGFYLLSSYPLAVRWVIVLASFGVGLLVALQSVQGQAFWQFVQGSRVELRKVVWPTLNDARRTTLVVMVVVVVVSLLLAGLDAIIRSLVKLLLGH